MERRHKPYSSVPSLHKRELKTDRVLAASNQKHKPGSDNTLISRARQDLESAYSAIHKLKRGKSSLKRALNEAVQEKNSVYHEARSLQKKLQSVKAQNQQLRGELESLQESQDLLTVLKEGILKRDKLITELRPRTDRASQVHNSISSLIEKIRPNNAIYLLLKKHIQCSHKFKELVKTGGAEDGLLQVLRFATELIETSDWAQNPFPVQLSTQPEPQSPTKVLATVEISSLSIQSPTKIPKPTYRVAPLEIFNSQEQSQKTHGS